MSYQGEQRLHGGGKVLVLCIVSAGILPGDELAYHDPGAIQVGHGVLCGGSHDDDAGDLKWVDGQIGELGAVETTDARRKENEDETGQ